MSKVLYGLRLIDSSGILNKVVLFSSAEKINEYILSCHFTGRYESIELKYFTDFQGKSNVLKIKSISNCYIEYYSCLGVEEYYEYKNGAWKLVRGGNNYPKAYYEALWNSGFKLFYNPYFVNESYKETLAKLICNNNGKNVVA